VKKTAAVVMAIAALAAVLAGCSSDADVASKNLSTAADNFEIQRRIIFVNGITDKYLLVIEGRCSLGNFDAERELSVTCKIGDENGGEFVKHFLGLSDNVTYVVEQTQAARVSAYHYRVVFKPEEIVPDIDLRTSN
jgi:predicted small secreted protein